MVRVIAAVPLIGLAAAGFQRTAGGFQTKTGGALVEIAVEGESAFRVSISHNGEPKRRESQMLAPKDRQVELMIGHDKDKICLKTSFGRACINENGSFEMEDSAGKALIQSSVLSSYENGYITVSLDKPVPGTQSVYYGAGAKAGASMQQTQAQPWIINHYGEGAEAWAPQYYSVTDSYAALAVSAQDWSNRTDYWSINSDVLVPDFGKYPANWTSSQVGVTWLADGPSLDLYLMPAHDIYAHLKAHADLTGKPRVPPRYAFGFLASRWGWTDQQYIEEVLGKFRSEKFPLDGFITDFEFFGTFNDYDIPNEGDSNYEDFSWNKQLFPDPVHQLKRYKEMGFHMGAIRKPRFGNPKYLLELKEHDWLLPDNLNQELYLKGPGRHINFTTQEAKEWYAEKNQHYLDEGISFWWNDEGEAYYFQFQDWNVAQEIGFKQRDTNERFFSLNRVYTPGMQRSGASVWTGDIPVSWQALQQQPGYMHNYNLAGNVYLACDSGGFAGGANVSSELLARWYWSSAFFPVMRVHSSCTTNGHDCVVNGETLPTTPHFPFLFGKEAADAMRNALEMRYKMIPMLYSLGHLAYETGAPITRPLIMEFDAEDEVDGVALGGIEDQWLVGDGLMTAPVLTEGGQRRVRFPHLLQGEVWYEFGSVEHAKSDTSDYKVSLQETLVFVRSGTLVPLGPVIQHTGELPGPDAQLEMHVYAGRDGTFTLVEDDGESRDYEIGFVRRTRFHWDDESATISWKVAGEASHASMFDRLVVKLFSVDAGAKTSDVVRLGEDGSYQFAFDQTLV